MHIMIYGLSKLHVVGPAHRLYLVATIYIYSTYTIGLELTIQEIFQQRKLQLDTKNVSSDITNRMVLVGIDPVVSRLRGDLNNHYTTEYGIKW